MLKNPAHKYMPAPHVNLTGRQWPDRGLTTPPIWLSTDLRDGNQALHEPMNGEQKIRLFKQLCAIGFKEIEVAFPSASRIEYDFVRELIEGGHIPPDVTIAVLTPAREALIQRTIQSLQGARRAIVHVYNATSKIFREQVFGMTPEQVMALAVDAVHHIRRLTENQPETEWVLEYSPETFTATEPEFALSVCDAVTTAWGATPDNKVILNLPATVECSMPNVYADQIEWMHRHLAQRNSVILSVHPHNDRGSAVAAAEMAQLAGAERVEGCLFGNGERTGNVDLVTLALNLYTQGIAPGLDFSDLPAIRHLAEEITSLPVHPRHPYAGDLVFTAFSGSHQDAIKKGFAARSANERWQMPYLPIDPADIGSNYDAVIRVNSQSGKGGMAWLLEREYGLILPRRLQIAFAATVQRHLDHHGREVDAQELWQLFTQHYRRHETPCRYVSHQLHNDGAVQHVRLIATYSGKNHALTGRGNGPLAAVTDALQHLLPDFQINYFTEQSLGSDAQAEACAYIEASIAGSPAEHGAGIDVNSTTAAIMAIFSAANRLLSQEAPLPAAERHHSNSFQLTSTHNAINCWQNKTDHHVTMQKFD